MGKATNPKRSGRLFAPNDRIYFLREKKDKIEGHALTVHRMLATLAEFFEEEPSVKSAHHPVDRFDPLVPHAGRDPQQEGSRGRRRRRRDQAVCDRRLHHHRLAFVGTLQSHCGVQAVQFDGAEMFLLLQLDFQIKIFLWLAR